MMDKEKRLLKATAVILAAGVGKRMGMGVSKQYLTMGKKPILVHTLEKFEKASLISDVIIVVSEEDVSYVKEEICGKHKLAKVTKVAIGGKERQDSVRKGLQCLDGDTDIVMTHDGVRPFISPEYIDLLIRNVSEKGAITLGVPVKDTIKSIGYDGCITNTLDRSSLWLTQTPQVFLRHIICDAHEHAHQEGIYETDDAALVERMGVPVVMMQGSSQNIKITTPEDLDMGTYILKQWSNKMKIGIGYDSHRLVKGRALIIGGVEIPNDLGLLGHSDADVLLHAICDAILGALGDGDIGRHFPDTDMTYKDISSLKLLQMVKERAAVQGFSVGNVDATVIVDKPKLRSYITKMILNISQILEIDPSMVNIKATTNEGMGFVGRNEGIAVFSVVSLEEGMKCK